MRLVIFVKLNGIPYYCYKLFSAFSSVNYLQIFLIRKLNWIIKWEGRLSIILCDNRQTGRMKQLMFFCVLIYSMQHFTFYLIQRMWCPCLMWCLFLAFLWVPWGHLVVRRYRLLFSTVCCYVFNKTSVNLPTDCFFFNFIINSETHSNNLEKFM